MSEQAGKVARLRPALGFTSLAAALALVATGCAQQPVAEKEEVDVSAEATAGGDLTVLIEIPARSFDPAVDNTMASTGDGARNAAVFDHLLYLDPATGEAIPHVAESLTPNDDGTVWTLTLRDGIEFSDGTAYDAEAVKYTYEHIVEVGVQAIGRTVDTWTMDVVDPLTLEITTPEATMHLDKLIADSLPYIVSPTAMEEDPEGFAEDPVGAGPYMLDEWVRDSHEVYVKNPNYWQEGKPHLDSVRMELVSDAAQRVNAISTGQADMQTPSASSDLALIDQAENAGLNVASIDVNGGGWIYLNNQRAPFDDVRAREAIYRAIDRTGLAEVAQGSPSARAIETLFTETSPFYAEDLTFPEPDAERAQELFDELADEGTPVEFDYVNVAGDVNARQAQYIQSQLSEFENVSVTIDTIDLPAARERVFMNRDFDMSPYPGAYRYPDPEPALYNLLITDGSSNTPGYSNADVDDALDAARATTDPDERAEQYRIVQERFMADLPGLFTFQPRIDSVMTDEITGLVVNSRGTLVWSELGFRE